MARRKPGSDTLLDLDGQVLIIDPAGEYIVRFEVKRVVPTPERPFGLKYSLTLHGPDGTRLVGFDNAHAVRRSRGPGGKPSTAADHVHRQSSVRPYRFRDANSLLADFWAEVDRMMQEKGII